VAQPDCRRAETNVLGALLFFASNNIVKHSLLPLGGSFSRVSRSGRSGGGRVLRGTDVDNSITVFVALSVPLYRRLLASASTVNSQSVAKKRSGTASPARGADRASGGGDTCRPSRIRVITIFFVTADLVDAVASRIISHANLLIVVARTASSLSRSSLHRSPRPEPLALKLNVIRVSERR
jgi:hypothetical protein